MKKVMYIVASLFVIAGLAFALSSSGLFKGEFSFSGPSFSNPVTPAVTVTPTTSTSTSGPPIDLVVDDVVLNTEDNSVDVNICLLEGQGDPSNSDMVLQYTVYDTAGSTIDSGVYSMNQTTDIQKDPSYSAASTDGHDCLNYENVFELNKDTLAESSFEATFFIDFGNTVTETNDEVNGTNNNRTTVSSSDVGYVSTSQEFNMFWSEESASITTDIDSNFNYDFCYAGLTVEYTGASTNYKIYKDGTLVNQINIGLSSDECIQQDINAGDYLSIEEYGEYSIEMVIDEDEDFEEVDESDNTLAFTLIVTADTESAEGSESIFNLSMETEPWVYSSGYLVGFRYCTEDTEGILTEGDTQNFAVYVDGDTSPAYSYSDVIPDNGSCENYYVNVADEIGLVADGSYNLVISLDYDEVWTESNEDDNTGTLMIQVNDGVTSEYSEESDTEEDSLSAEDTPQVEDVSEAEASPFEEGTSEDDAFNQAIEAGLSYDEAVEIGERVKEEAEGRSEENIQTLIETMIQEYIDENVQELVDAAREQARDADLEEEYIDQIGESVDESALEMSEEEFNAWVEEQISEAQTQQAIDVIQEDTRTRLEEDGDLSEDEIDEVVNQIGSDQLEMSEQEFSTWLEETITELQTVEEADTAETQGDQQEEVAEPDSAQEDAVQEVEEAEAAVTEAEDSGASEEEIAALQDALDAALAAAEAAQEAADAAAEAAESAASSSGDTYITYETTSDTSSSSDDTSSSDTSTEDTSSSDDTSSDSETVTSDSDFPFPDVDPDTWEGEAIGKLYEMGIIKGDSEGNARPWDYANRAEVLAMLMRSLYDEDVLSLMTFEVTFSDVSPTAWYYNHVHAALKLGIIQDAEFFNPGTPMTRAEFVQALVNAANKACVTCDADFSDVKRTDWFYRALATALDAQIVSGYEDGTFRPNDYINRASVSSVIVKALAADWVGQ